MFKIRTNTDGVPKANDGVDGLPCKGSMLGFEFWALGLGELMPSILMHVDIGATTGVAQETGKTTRFPKRGEEALL